MSVQCVNVPMLEAKIYSQTDIIIQTTDFKGLSTLATVPIIRATRHAGAGIVFDTRSYCSTRDRKSHLKIFATSSEKKILKYLPFQLALPMNPYHAAAVAEFGQ